MTHTPGPWFTSEADSEHTTEVAVCDKDGIIAMCGDAFGPFGREHRDNARLIAAAPDMLAALEAALSWVDSGSMPSHATCQQMRAAIAKATSP